MGHAGPVRILVRTGALALAIGAYYGIAALLPDGREEIVGLIAFVTVVGATLFWSRRDGRSVPRDESQRDWLVVAAIVAVFWWATLALFEGSSDVLTQLRLNFLSVLATAGILFVAALVGLTLGRNSRPL